ncbi:putative reverse transcriptase domain-containing protein, partial [Tanacetum coccineum]
PINLSSNLFSLVHDLSTGAGSNRSAEENGSAGANWSDGSEVSTSNEGIVAAGITLYRAYSTNELTFLPLGGISTTLLATIYSTISVLFSYPPYGVMERWSITSSISLVEVDGAEQKCIKPSTIKRSTDNRKSHPVDNMTCVSIAGIPPYDVIEEMAKTIVTTIAAYKNETSSSPVTAKSSMIGLDAMLESGMWFIRNNPLILKKWHPDVNLLKEDVGTVSVWVKFYKVPVTAFSKDGLSATATKLGTPLMHDYYTSDMCACCKVFGHVQEECPKNIGAGATKNVKKTSQTPKGISVRQKMGFKPIKQVFQRVSIKPTANNSINKKSNVEPTKEISKSTPFENVDASSPSTIPIIEKIDKIEKLIIDGKVTLVDDEGKPLEKVASLCDYDSEDKVASVDNEMACFLAKKYGYNTQSLLEQWT